MALKSNNFTSVKYHNIFDYKLTKEEALRWQYRNEKIVVSEIKNKQSLPLRGKSRLQREKYSRDKLIIAKKAANLIAKIPTVKFVGITGALAMNNADKNSDIDLMIITKNGYLWTTRLFVYLLIALFGIQIRKPRNKQQKDRLCLNMWLDENDLAWDKKDRNIYTAHEIAQIVPLVNKDETYEKFLYLNKWILEYWPNAVTVHSTKYIVHSNKINFLEKIAFWLQYQYMKNKITREIVTSTRAIFHPNDWSKVVMSKLSY